MPPPTPDQLNQKNWDCSLGSAASAKQRGWRECAARVESHSVPQQERFRLDTWDFWLYISFKVIMATEWISVKENALEKWRDFHLRDGEVSQKLQKYPNLVPNSVVIPVFKNSSINRVLPLGKGLAVPTVGSHYGSRALKAAEREAMPLTHLQSRCTVPQGSSEPHTHFSALKAHDPGCVRHRLFLPLSTVTQCAQWWDLSGWNSRGHSHGVGGIPASRLNELWAGASLP